MENYLKVMNKKRQTLQTVMGVVSITFEVKDGECRFTGGCERWEDDRRITDTYEVYGTEGYLCNACGDTIDKFIPWPDEGPLESKHTVKTDDNGRVTGFTANTEESFEAPERYVLVPEAIGEREFFEAAQGWREYDISDSINNPEHARVIYGSFRAAVAKLGMKSVTPSAQQNDSVAAIVQRELRACAPLIDKNNSRYFGGKPEVNLSMYSAHQILLPHEFENVTGGPLPPRPEFTKACLHVVVGVYDPVTAVNRIKSYVERQPNDAHESKFLAIVIHDDTDTVPQGSQWYFPNEDDETPHLLAMRID